MHSDSFARHLLIVLFLAVAPSATIAQSAQSPVLTITVDGAGISGEVYRFAGKDAVLIGRDATNHVRLPSRGVSRSHAKITCIDRLPCLLTDLRSTNGTRLNGVPVPYGATPELRSGDVVGLPDYELRVVIGD